MDEKLKSIIREKAVDGKLPCAKAFHISKEYDISIAKIGRTADEIGIKISACQLGCFR